MSYKDWILSDLVFSLAVSNPAELNNMLGELDPVEMDTLTITLFLSVPYSRQDEFSNYKSFLDRSRKHLELVEPGRVDQLLMRFDRKIKD